jgi:hypothetical protein
MYFAIASKYTMYFATASNYTGGGVFTKPVFDPSGQVCLIISTKVHRGSL